MQSQANPKPTGTTNDRFARKARVLLDLFGPAGVQRLRQVGLPENLSQALDRIESSVGTATTDQSAQSNLIERFRTLGLFSPDMPSRTEVSETEQDHPKVTGRAALLERVSRHLVRDQLGEEHPAVIALVLRSQPRDMQTRVLKALPGPTARATMRYLKGSVKTQTASPPPRTLS